jgi:type IV conjugative transfer system lipoprotein TraV
MKKFFYLSFLLLGASCSSSVKGNWSCPTPEGGKGSCISIKDADLAEISSSKEKPNFTFLDSAQKIEIKLIAPKLSELKKIQQEKNQKNEDQNLNSESSEKGVKLRTQERVGKIWFAPHIDSEGNQYSESVVYVVDEESKWVMQR